MLATLLDFITHVHHVLCVCSPKEGHLDCSPAPCTTNCSGGSPHVILLGMCPRVSLAQYQQACVRSQSILIVISLRTTRLLPLYSRHKVKRSLSDFQTFVNLADVVCYLVFCLFSLKIFPAAESFIVSIWSSAWERAPG